MFVVFFKFNRFKCACDRCDARWLVVRSYENRIENRSPIGLWMLLTVAKLQVGQR